jgi:environmental stress-induced protein Ves
VRVIRHAAYRRMRWKNGQGETAEIAIAPEGAALDHFDWRISMARIEAPGPFSSFAGTDRTLTVLEGEGLRLTVDGRPAIELTGSSPPYSFAGDAPAAATLLGGAVTDLNVMTRRGVLWHRVERVAAHTRRARAAPIRAVLCVAGAARVVAGEVTAELGALDTLVADDSDSELEITAAAAAGVLLIEIGWT